MPVWMSIRKNSNRCMYKDYRRKWTFFGNKIKWKSDGNLKCGWKSCIPGNKTYAGCFMTALFNWQIQWELIHSTQHYANRPGTIAEPVLMANLYSAGKVPMKIDADKPAVISQKLEINRSCNSAKGAKRKLVGTYAIK